MIKGLFMASSHSDKRPLSPHLQVWRWHATMASSIFHRATGSINYIGIVAFTIWLAGTAGGGPDYFAWAFQGAFGLLVKLGLFVLTWSFSYHWLNGLRHLVWDFGKGFDPEGSNRRSIMIFALSPVPAIVIWLFALGVVS